MRKKVFCLFIVLVMLFSVVGIATASAATEGTIMTENKNSANGLYVGQYGDSDGNSKINIKDATNVQKYVAGMISLSQNCIAVSNVDGNKDVNVRDATAIQKHLAGISVNSNIGSYLYITGEHTHNYVLNAVISDCESDVYEVYSCLCGDEYQGKVIPARGHNYVDTVVAPTCTKNGYTSHKCSTCLYSYKDNYTSGGSHSYTSKVVAPTCTSQGYTQYTCSLCNTSYKDNYTAVTSHSYNSNGVCYSCGATRPVTDSKVAAFDSVASWFIRNGELTDDGESYGISTYMSGLSNISTAVFYRYYEDTIEIVVDEAGSDLFTWITITRGSNTAEYTYFLGEDLIVDGTFAINSITKNTSSLNCNVVYDAYGLYDYDPAVVKELSAACVVAALNTYDYYDSYYSIPSSLYELGFTRF